MRYTVTSQPKVSPQYRPILLTHIPLAQCHKFCIVSIWVSDDTVSTTELHITPFPSSRCTFSTTHQSHPSIYHRPWRSGHTAQAPIRQTAHIHRDRPFLRHNVTHNITRNILRIIMRNINTQYNAQYKYAI